MQNCLVLSNKIRYNKDKKIRFQMKRIFLLPFGVGYFLAQLSLSDTVRFRISLSLVLSLSTVK